MNKHNINSQNIHTYTRAYSIATRTHAGQVTLLRQSVSAVTKSDGQITGVWRSSRSYKTAPFHKFLKYEKSEIYVL